MRPRRALRLAALTAAVTTLAAFVLLNSSVHGGVRKQRRRVSSLRVEGVSSLGGGRVWSDVALSVGLSEGLAGAIS